MKHAKKWLAATTLCLLSASPGAFAQEGTQLEAGAFDLQPRKLKRRDGGTVEAQIGRLSVPENRKQPDSRNIEIGFLRLPAHEEASGPPLAYLTGGPGQSIVSSLERRGAVDQWLPFLELGDVILLDQRGTGVSRPNLGYRWAGETPVNLFRSEEDAWGYLEGVARAAVSHFRSEGVDLRGYTTEQSADDIDSLRRALGADKLNLLGFSYGTHLALSAVRRHGEHLANVVLLGVEGPNHTYKLPSTADVQLEKLALLVQADPAMAARIPDFSALLERVLTRLRAEPMKVRVRDRASGGHIEIPIGAEGLLAILRRDLGDASDLPVFPRLLHSIDQGDPRILEWFARKRFGLGAHAMGGVMDTASGATATRLARIHAEAADSPFGNVANFPYPRIGEVWEAPDLGDAYRAPITSPVRTLFLSGTLDFNTPPFQAEEVRWGFPNSSHIIVKNAGHEQILPHPAVRRAVLDFLRGESVDGVTATYPAAAVRTARGLRRAEHPPQRSAPLSASSSRRSAAPPPPRRSCHR